MSRPIDLVRSRPRRWTRGALAAGAAVALVAAGASSAHAATSPPASWTPATSTATFAYEPIDADTSTTQTFTLSNPGRTTTGALKVALSGSPAFTVTDDSCTDKSLRPAQTCTVTVQYAPTEPSQNDTATLVATTNKPATLNAALAQLLAALGLQPPVERTVVASHTLTGTSTAPAPVFNPVFRYDHSSPGFAGACLNWIAVSGLVPNTDYRFKVTQSDDLYWTGIFPADDAGTFILAVSLKPDLTFNIQLLDNDRVPLGTPLAPPSQEFTSHC